jgi:hypothetical protein
MFFTIYCCQGLLHTPLIEILESRGWKYIDFDAITPETYIDFAWVGGTIGNEYLKFDPRVYSLKTTLKNLLVGSGVRGDYRDKDVITNKYELYYNIVRLSPEIGKKHLCESYDLKRLTFLQRDQILISRPVGVGTGGGNGICMITNNIELTRTRFESSRKYKYIIASEYINNPFLIDGCKFHLRMYWAVYPDCKGNYNHSLYRVGKIITAAEPYKNSDWHNKRIHDSHFSQTSINRYFPDDIELSLELKDNIFTQMNDILNVAYKVILPHARCYADTQYGFEVFGCDFMITSDYIVKLLEINAKHDYGVDDLKKQNPEGFIHFCKGFYNWICNSVIFQICGEA